MHLSSTDITRLLTHVLIAALNRACHLLVQLVDARIVQWLAVVSPQEIKAERRSGVRTVQSLVTKKRHALMTFL